MSSPKIFVSATSGDLGSVRQLVKEALLSQGCHPVEQTNFPPDARTVAAMLRERIADCQALIHIVGFRYGAEPDPARLQPDAPRRSYTQMEYHLGREFQARRGPRRFRVYTFVCPENFPYDSAPPEPEDKSQLQQAHRALVLADEHLRERPADPDKLRERILALNEEVHQLRAAQTRTARLTLAVAVLVLGALAGLGWGIASLRDRTTTVQADAQALKQQQGELLRQFSADPEYLRANLRKSLEEKAAAELAAAKKAGADWRQIDEMMRRRDVSLRKADDILETIKAGLLGEPNPILLEATRLLSGPGVDETLQYLAAQDQRIWERAKEKKMLKAEAARQQQEELRPLLLKAQLESTKLDYSAAATILERLVGEAPDWWEPRYRLGVFLLELARYPEAEKHIRAAEAFAPGDRERAASLSSLADLLHTTNRLKEAEPLLRQTLKIGEEVYGPQHPSLAGDLNELAILLKETNRLPEAQSLLERALQIDQTALGPNDPGVARDLNNLGQLQMARGQLKEAEPFMRRALQIYETAFGPAHPSVAISLHNLAQLLHETNRLQEAEPLMRRALQIDEAIYGPNHPAVGLILNNLAQLLQETNRLKEAEPLMQRALKIDEAAYGADHPHLAGQLTNLAMFYRASNRPAEVEPLLARALKINETSYGPEHPKVANDLRNLAGWYHEAGRFAEAEPLMQRALNIHEASLGPNHPDVAIDLNNLAQLFQATHRLPEAEADLRRSLQINETVYGPEHPRVAGNLGNLAALFQDSRRFDEAEPLIKRALAIQEAAYGPHHPNVAVELNNLAQLFQDTQRLKEAEPLMKRALQIDENSYGPSDPNVARDLNNLALLFKAAGRLGEAVPLLERVLKIDEASQGPEDPSVAIDLHQLADVFRMLARLDQAEPLQRRSLQILVKYRQTTKTEHPNFGAVVTGYGRLLKQQGLGEAAVREKLALLDLEAAMGSGPFQTFLSTLEKAEPPKTSP